MNQLEQNIRESFRLAKNDIIKLQDTIAVLSQNQERLMEWITDTREKETMLYQRVKDLKIQANKAVKTRKVTLTKTAAKTVKRAKKTYIASRTGKTVHDSNCPFAKKIQPKSKVRFSSKAKALNVGYKACECIKKY